jgi:phosphoglycerate dehydrogenase-like enzyme
VKEEKRKLVLIAVNMSEEDLFELKREFPQYEFEKSSAKKEALSIAKEAEILVTLAPSEEIIRSAKTCKWLQVLTAGVEDYLKIDAVRDNDQLLLTNASGIHSIQISEHIFAMILSITRGIKIAVLNQNLKKWEGLEDSKERPKLTELGGKTMLVVGLGSIGLATAKKGKAFGMKILGIKNNAAKKPKDPEYSQYVDQVGGPEKLENFVTISDFIVNCLPLTHETLGIFDSKIFSNMKTSAIFVNVGRGKTVVERDLIEALRSGKLGGLAWMCLRGSRFIRIHLCGTWRM